MKIQRSAMVMLLGLVAALVVGCAGLNSDKAGGQRARPPVILTLADGEVDLSNARPFADAVNRLSHGTLQIEIKSPWRPNDARYEVGLIRDVEAGRVQMGITATRAFASVGIDGFQALEAPFLIDNAALEQRVLGSDITKRMLQGLGHSGLVGLAILPGPLRRPVGFTRPLLSTADYRGRRIGIRPSAVSQEVFRALGATPVVQQRGNPTSGEAVSGLDGIESNLAAISSGFDVPGATLTGNVVFAPRPNVIFMNKAAFDSLSAGQRSIVLRAATEARSAGVFEPDAGPLQDLCRRGMKIIDASSADLAGLRQAVLPVYGALESNASTKAFIAEIMSLRRAVGGSPDAVSCGSTDASGRITTTPTRLDGTWEVTYTRSQFIAAGAYPDELCCENWGHYSLSLRRGRFAERGTKPGQSAAGTYKVTGDTIRFYRTDHAYAGSDTEIWGPYTWSVYRDTVTFKKQPSPEEMPTSLVVEPWRKTGG